MVKRILLALALLGLGTGVGGAAAWGTRLLLGPPAPAGAVRAGAAGQGGPHDEPLAYVAVPALLVPLVTADGRLAGYVQADVALGVPEEEAERVGARLPLLLHAVNMRSFRTPLAAGPDGLLPDVELLRRLVLDAASAALGDGLVREVAVTRAVPA